MSLKSRLALCVTAAGLMAAADAGAATFTYANGDLLLGFRKTGATNDYIVNLGPSSNFPAVGAPITLTLGNLGADLSSTGSAGLFGATWNNDATVFWSVSGAAGGVSPGPGANGEPARTIFATRPESPVGTIATPWDTNTSSGQSGPDSRMRTMGNTVNGLASTANSDFGVIQAAASTNSYASYHTGASSYTYFAGGIEGNFGAGTAGTALDLFRMRPAANLGSVGPGDYIGKFTIDNSGQVTFTPAAIPEPAGLSILALAAGALVLRRRKPSTES